jgi:hypothetical protein
MVAATSTPAAVDSDDRDVIRISGGLIRAEIHPGINSAIQLPCGEVLEDVDYEYLEYSNRSYAEYYYKLDFYLDATIMDSSSNSAVTSVTWTSANNVTQEGPAGKTQDLALGDGSIWVRHSSIACHHELPQYFTFVSEVQYDDGTTETLTSVVKVYVDRT